MSTDFNLNTVSFTDPNGRSAFAPRSAVVSLLQLLGKGFREILGGVCEKPRPCRRAAAAALIAGRPP